MGFSGDQTKVMKQIFFEISVKTKGQGLYDFTEETLNWLNEQKINNGILNINILHTSASLVIQENADPDVLKDLKNFFDRLAPMDNKLYKHTAEGKDDMPAHIKSALTNNQITLSIKNKKLMLGTWQGLYLFEHRLESHARTLSHHFMGD
jgi:secondary thiamine-phosphate synthase enzyme